MRKLFLCKSMLVALTFLCLGNLRLSSQNIDGELKLADNVDSLSLLIGIAQSNGLKEYLVEKMDVDTVYMSDFCRGLYEGAQSNSNPSQTAFNAGVQIGQQISSQMIQGINHELFGSDDTKSISMKLFLAGFVLGINRGADDEIFSKASEDAQRLMERIKESYITPDQKAYKKKNEDWLANNKTKPGVNILPSGVQYKIIKKGTEKKPSEDSEVVCHYEGHLIDGTEFDSSYKRKEPITFRPSQVIKGWTEALTSMPVGSIWEVYIPQELAYGSREEGIIAPFSTLVFKIELISIK